MTPPLRLPILKIRGRGIAPLGTAVEAWGEDTPISITGRDVVVELDGHDVTNGLTRLDLTISQGDANSLTLAFKIEDVEVDAEVLVALEAMARNRETRDAIAGDAPDHDEPPYCRAPRCHGRCGRPYREPHPGADALLEDDE